MKNLSVQQSAELLSQKNSIPLIDVRTPTEYGSVHAKGCSEPPDGIPGLGENPVLQRGRDPCNLPVGRSLHEGLPEVGGCRVYQFGECGGGNFRVCGRTSGCGRKKVMSLERQVRIAAGSLVIIGIAIGQFVHPAGFGLSALIGAGLVFSAVTNTCGMGMLIAKMLWNRT